MGKEIGRASAPLRFYLRFGTVDRNASRSQENATCPFLLVATMPQTADRSAFESLADDNEYSILQLRNEVAGLVASGMATDEAAELVGIPIPDRLLTCPPFTPTPAQIRQHCSDIQSGWTSTEWRSREAMGRRDPVEMQVVRVRELGEV